jgi:tRNA-dihydrouridine synthase C
MPNPMNSQIKIHLAPMEGVVDFVLRDLLTAQGGIDICVTEFIRVTEHLHSPPVLYRYAPELKMNSHTRSGTPLFVQFLGGHATPLAENAAQAAELGAYGIDLNFGCPAKTVNRHDGGASLLKTPERIFKIVSEVRKAVPNHIPVTAKMRLGFEDPSHCFDNAQAINDASANWVTIHCRTKTDGYRPPAYWEWVPQIKEKIQIPIVANGEIWTVEDFWRCQEICQTERTMIGRGLVANPLLANQVKVSVADKESSATKTNWPEISKLLPQFFSACSDDKSPHFAQARTKQWLKALSLRHPEAIEVFEQTKVHTQPSLFRAHLENLL